MSYFVDSQIKGEASWLLEGIVRYKKILDDPRTETARV